MSASNSAARQAAALNGKISDLEEELKELEVKIHHDLEKLEEKLEVMSGKMYKHFAEAQVDSLRLEQVTEDVNSVQSSIRYAARTVAAVVGTALFGVFVAIISSGIGGN